MMTDITRLHNVINIQTDLMDVPFVAVWASLAELVDVTLRIPLYNINSELEIY